MAATLTVILQRCRWLHPAPNGLMVPPSWGRYHGGRRPSSDDSPTVIPPSALDKLSIMKCYRRLRTCSHSCADDGNASWYSVCRVPMVKWRLDYENCPYLTVVGLYDTGPWSVRGLRASGFEMFGGRSDIEGSLPKWCISTVYHAWYTPFWSETLDTLMHYSC